MTLSATNRHGVLVIRGDKDSLRLLKDAISDCLLGDITVGFTLANGDLVMVIGDNRDVVESVQTLLNGKEMMKALRDAVGGLESTKQQEEGL